MTRNQFRRGFTLIQLLIVISVIAILSALLLGTISRGRAAAQRSQCDIRLKGIALALDAYHSVHGKYPKSLTDLVTEKFLPTADGLRCPADVRPTGSYDEYYVRRAPRDAENLPVVMCPLHERSGNHGAQAYLGHYTEMNTTSPAVLTSANDATVERPDGKGAFTATSGQELRGGDRIRTGGGGRAIITFADGTTADLKAGCDVTVLQSFLDGQSQGPLYTIVKQTLGRAIYEVHHGSKFDVATPTATAGARGTKFEITVNAAGDTSFYLYEGDVVLTTLERSAWAPKLQTVTITGLLQGLTGLLGLGGGGGLLGGLFGG